MEKDLAYFLKYTKQNGECLEWTRCFNTDGYARTAWGGHSNGKVHRIVYELFYKKDPTGYVIRHTCDNPKCINPEHLLIGTNMDNIRDRDERERHGKAKLSHQDVRMIRLLYHSNKFLQKDIADIFEVNYRTISSIIKGHHFKYVK